MRNNPGVKTIKLKDLLKRNLDVFKYIDIVTSFPPIEIGSITLVDQIVLISLLKQIKPHQILEIGTYQGFTTRLLANNAPESKIFSIDLPRLEGFSQDHTDSQKVLCDGDYNDNYLREVQNTTGEIYLNNLSGEIRDRIVLIKEDSRKIDYRQIGAVEYAFIDGGHDFDTVKSDTESVRTIMSAGVIVWHDYNSEIHSGVTEYLHSISSERHIFHVQGGLCAFELLGQAF